MDNMDNMYTLKSIMFTTPTCVYCEFLATLLIGIAKDSEIPLELYSIDVADHLWVADKYDVRKAPTTYIGQELIIGIQSEDELLEILNRAYSEKQNSLLDIDEKLMPISKPYVVDWYIFSHKLLSIIKNQIKMYIKGEKIREMGDKTSMHFIHTLGMSLIHDYKGKNVGDILKISSHIIGGAAGESVTAKDLEGISKELSDISERLGICQFELIDHSEEKIVYRVYDSYLSTGLYSNLMLDFPYCAWIGEYLLSSLKSTKVDVVGFSEVKCEAMGDPYDEFVIYTHERKEKIRTEVDWEDVSERIQDILIRDLTYFLEGNEIREIGDMSMMHLIHALGLALIMEFKGVGAGKILKSSARTIGIASGKFSGAKDKETAAKDLVYIMERLGLGRLEIVDISKERAKYRVHECYLDAGFKDRINLGTPYCFWIGHYLIAYFETLGMRCGGFKETECVAMGNDYCEFVVDHALE